MYQADATTFSESPIHTSTLYGMPYHVKEKVN